MSTPKRPVLRYHGGKFRLAPWIIGHFPPHRCYVEPFGGAAGVLVQKDRSYAEVYNDIDGDIVNLFRVLRDPGKCVRLIDLLLLTPYARDEFDAAYEASGDPVERARRTLVRAEMGFGSAGATKGRTGFRIDTRRKYGTAQDLWTRFPEALALVCERLQGVMIENRPAIDVIRQHDAVDTLIYVDPPYMHETRSGGIKQARGYAYEMRNSDHAELLATLNDCAGMVVLSGYATDMYVEALKGWSVATTSARISAGRGTALRTESLWLNPACSEALNRCGLFGGAAA